MSSDDETRPSVMRIPSAPLGGRYPAQSGLTAVGPLGAYEQRTEPPHDHARSMRETRVFETMHAQHEARPHTQRGMPVAAPPPLPPAQPVAPPPAAPQPAAPAAAPPPFDGPVAATSSAPSAHVRPVAHPAEAQGGRVAAPPAASTGAAPSVRRPKIEPGANRIFEREALENYANKTPLTSSLRVVPLNTAVMIATLGAMILTVLVIMSIGQIDLTARGRGVIRATDGVQPLMFEVEGIVRELLVQNGDSVAAGQVLARLDSTRLRASLQEAEEQLGAVEERSRHDEQHGQDAYDRDMVLLRERSQLTRDRIQSQQTSVAAHERELARVTALVREGLVSERTRREAAEMLLVERRNLLTLQGELAQIAQQITSLEQGHRAAQNQRAQQLRDARNHRDVTQLLLSQTELRAARPGRVESLLFNVGDLVGPGRAVARLVSLTTNRQVTAFMPERERAFVQPGAKVRVEFDQLPVGEFGSATASVVRASSEVAGQPELEHALGAAAPAGVHFAVTLELADDAASRGLYGRVASGSLVTVRMPVRSRRIITLIFDPVRKWLD